MITLEGNIKILKLGYKTGHIEVVDLENDILYVGEVISEVIYERGKPLKVKLYHYTIMNGLDEENRKLKEENGWLKKSIKRQQSSNKECSKYIEEVVKENEQLKSTNMEMEDYLGRLEERIIELEKENQEMKKK